MNPTLEICNIQGCPCVGASVGNRQLASICIVGDRMTYPARKSTICDVGLGARRAIREPRQKL
jgi:hypothetical protein